MATDIKQYIEKLAQESGLEDVSKQALLQAISNEKFSKGLGDSILRQEDYSRSMDEIRGQRDVVGKHRQELDEWYKNNLDIYNEAIQARTLAEAKAAGYEKVYGVIEGLTPTNPAVTVTSPTNGDYISRKDMEALLGNVYNRVGESVAELIGLGFEHFNKFKEPLDVRKLAQVAAQSAQRPLSPFRAGYQEMIREQESKLTEEATQKLIEQKEKEAVQNYISTHNIPIETRPSEGHVFFNRPEAGKSPATDEAKRQAFVRAYEEAGATK